MSAIINNLEKMLGSERENELLHYSLGNEYLKLDDFSKAVDHFRKSLGFKETYSAAWKMLGKALLSSGDVSEAIDVYSSGIKVAEDQGDIQAAKEMRVFLKRAQKQLDQTG